MRYFLLIFILPYFSFGQWNYKTKYTHGVFFEALGLTRGVSANYNRILYHADKGFLSSSVGIAFIPGIDSAIFKNSGLGIPITLTYNHSLGDLDRRLRSRVTRKCMYRPQKYEFEWFGEGGVGLHPLYYGNNAIKFEQVVTGYLGLRTHLFIRRPYKQKDLVLFARVGYSPYFRFKPNYREFRYMPYETGAIGGSIGFGF